MQMSRGELLFAGCVQFPAGTGADGKMRTLDIPVLAVENDGIVELSVRNGSATEIVAVDAGHLRKFRPYPGVCPNHAASSGGWIAATGTAASDIFTTTNPHGLMVGDRVIFAVGGGGGDAGATVNLYDSVVNPTGLMTDFVFQGSATPGGTVLNVDAAEEVLFRYVASPTNAIPSANGVVATDVYNCLTPHGLTVGDAVILNANATVDIVVVNTVYYVIATASALQFQLSAARGGTTLNVGATDAVMLKLVDEFVSLTTFSVPKFAAGTYLVNVAGLVSKVVQGFGASPGGSRLCFSPGDQTYDAFAVSVEIRRA